MVPGLNPQTAQVGGVPSNPSWLPLVVALQMNAVKNAERLRRFHTSNPSWLPLVVNVPMNAADKAELRRQMRRRRRALSAAEQAKAAEQFSARIWPLLRPPACRHVAVYLAVGGELDLTPLIETLWQTGKQVYLPVVTRLAPERLAFCRYQPDTPLQANRYGIGEPVQGTPWPTRHLDAVLLPLTAFDAAGNRLGMGGGFYDRPFAWRRHSGLRKPKLIGVGYDWQEVASIKTEPHDVAVQFIVTNKMLKKCSAR